MPDVDDEGEPLDAAHVRGGSHFNLPAVVRSAYRYDTTDWKNGHETIGFRIIRPLRGESSPQN